MPEFGHTGSFYVNVDETIGASEDEDPEEAEQEGEFGSFGGVTLPEWESALQNAHSLMILGTVSE